jgi:hypothetical protein
MSNKRSGQRRKYGSQGRRYTTRTVDGLPHRGENGQLVDVPRGEDGMLIPPQPADPATSHFDAPKNPDFTWLMDIMAEMDEEGLTSNVQNLPVDLATMAYVAKSRAMKALDQIGEPETPEEERLIIMWLDAYVAGFRYCQKTYDEMTLEGNRRSLVKEQDQAL